MGQGDLETIGTLSIPFGEYPWSIPPNGGWIHPSETRGRGSSVLFFLTYRPSIAFFLAKRPTLGMLRQQCGPSMAPVR
jgi:hypothetical protein